MAVSESVVYPNNQVAHWEPRLPAARNHKSILPHIASPGKDPKSKSEV